MHFYRCKICVRMVSNFHFRFIQHKACPSASHWVSHPGCGFAGWQICCSLLGGYCGEIGNLYYEKGAPLLKLVFYVNYLYFTFGFQIS